LSLAYVPAYCSGKFTSSHFMTCLQICERLLNTISTW